MFYSLLLFLCLSFSGFCAGPVTHIYFAQQYLEAFPKYTPEEAQLFLVGTLFPDIRYLGKINRSATHYDKISLEEIIEEPSPFLAGLKFHSYVDLVRENFVVNRGMYSRLPKLASKHKQATFLKLMEDEVLFDEIDRDGVRSILQSIYTDELTWGMDDQTIAYWHKIVSTFLTYNPSRLLQYSDINELEFMGLPRKEILQWNVIFLPTINSDEIQSYMEALLEHFETQLVLEPKQACFH